MAPESVRFGLLEMWVLSAFLALTSVGCEPATQAPTGAPPPSVSVVPVLEAEIADRWVGVGHTRAIRRVELRVRVTGRITGKFFKDGDKVTEGQKLFQLDSRPYEAALSQARANVANARAEYRRAKADAERGRQLFERNAISTEEFQTKAALADAASAQVKAAIASLETAQLDLKYCTIESPLTGRIGETTVELGSLVNPSTSTPLATVSTMDPMYVEFTTDERLYLQAARRAQENKQPTDDHGKRDSDLIVALQLADGGFYAYRGEFTFLDPEANRETGTVRVRASFPNPENFLRPGFFARVYLMPPEKVKRILVPQEAVMKRQAGSFVFVLEDDQTVAETKVDVGSNLGDLSVVREGLKPGQKVVYAGIQKCRDGLKVQANEKPALTLASDPLTSNPQKAFDPKATVPVKGAAASVVKKPTRAMPTQDAN